jgi:hypothetical protein
MKFEVLNLQNVYSNYTLYTLIILLIFSKKWKKIIFLIPLTSGKETFRPKCHFEGQIFELNFLRKNRVALQF